MVKRDPFPSAKKATTTIVLTQSTITLLAALAGFVLADLKAAYSAVVGGGISIIATLYFAQRVFSLRPGTPAAKIARRVYAGEAIKLVLTAALFFAVVKWLNVSFLPLFLTYAITLLAYWLVLPFTLDTPVKTL
jgi:ATP synthase protein I